LSPFEGTSRAVSVSVSATTHHRLDDLRRLAAGLASGVGVAPARASALASQLLWFDAAGASSRGIASLPTWLDRIDRREIDPLAEGRAHHEHAGTALFDGQNGLPPLVLAKAAGIAAEKARDVGVGIVRVANLGPTGPAAPIAADLAVGPFVAAIAGPGPSWTVAVPMPEGLPAVYDSALDGPDAGVPDWLGPWSPWTAALAGSDGWAILALAVAALEPLTTFQDRVAAALGGSAEGPGRLSPVPWDGRRRAARERGVSLDDVATKRLHAWADRLGVPWPASTAP